MAFMGDFGTSGGNRFLLPLASGCRRVGRDPDDDEQAERQERQVALHEEYPDPGMAGPGALFRSRRREAIADRLRALGLGW